MALSKEKLLDFIKNNIKTDNDGKVLTADCDTIEFLLDNCEITIPKENRFFVKVNCVRIQESIYTARANACKQEIIDNGLMEGHIARAFTGYYDFGHTTTEWKSVISLGIYGLKERILQFINKNNDETKHKFYCEIDRVYSAALRFMKRAAEEAALCGKTEMAQGLNNLVKGKPSNLFEAMQTSLIYYTLQQFFDGTYLRTLGRLDSLFYPFFINEDATKAEKMVYDYINEIDTLEATANIPFALGGTGDDGKSLVNKLSYIFLNTYKEAQTTNTKLHLLCSKNIPTDIIELAFESIRKGKNSIVFMSDEKIIESLEKLGEEHDDAVDYHVVGCYECGGNGELTCSCNAKVNLPKVLELTLNNGRDMLTDKLIGIENDGNFNTYEDLYLEFTKQLVYICNCAMKETNIYETHYSSMHSSPFLSGTYTSALENGGDLYSDYTAKYNNSSVNALGLATVTDSLAAIKKLVFEDKTLTMNEIVNLLKSNWKDAEPLRMYVKNKFPKFGIADKNIDSIAKNIVDLLSDTISKKPNARGGIYRLGLFSVDWRWEFGEKTAASADGRLSGEPISQNTTASFGADRNGATAHLTSVATIDTSKTPNGTVVDIDLHSSAVKGENGLKTLVATLKTHFDLGGFAVHYNVLDAEILKDAKLNPEKYPNLQVRLCGWNVLFSTLSEKEKDEFIARSMK